MKKEMFTYIKAVSLFVLSSGLIFKAIQIYGLGYYTGFLRGHGLDYYFFQLEWQETALWAYFASRDFGIKYLDVLGVHPTTLLKWMAVCFVLILVLMYRIDIAKLFKSKENSATNRHEKNLFLSLIGSYAMVIAFLLLSFFVIVWVFLPDIASDHGQRVAERSLKPNEDVCKTDSQFWLNDCITVDVKGQTHTGVIIVRSKDRIGLLTNDGALTFTLDKNYSYFNAMASPQE